jgi:hypothetical protein
MLLLLIMLSLSLSVKAQDGPMLHLYCAPGLPRITIAMSPVQALSPEQSATLERIDVAKLVIYSEEDERGDVYREGSRSIERNCGRLAARISGAFFNARPQGEMGAADDYPIVELFDGATPLTVPLAIGSCESSNGLYGVSVACPANWASEVSVFFSQGGAVVHLHHEYNEYRGQR